MLCIIHIRGWLQSGSNQQVSDLGGDSNSCVFLCLRICVFVDTSTCSQVCDCSSGKDCVCIHSVRASIPWYVVRASIPPLSPAGRAPGPPFTPTWVKETFSHRYLGGDLALFLHRVRILPISEIKDGSSQESVLLKKLLALSTKYSGSEFPTDQDLLGLVRVSWMCTTLGQRMRCNCGIPAAPCAPAEFWTSSKHTVASNLHQGRLASKIPNLSTLLLCKNGCWSGLCLVCNWALQV